MVFGYLQKDRESGKWTWTCLKEEMRGNKNDQHYLIQGVVQRLP